MPLLVWQHRPTCSAGGSATTAVGVRLAGAGGVKQRTKPTMKVTKLFTADERAVSPVVGVALLIAIAVILAAVIGAVVLGLGTTGAETPTAQLSADFDGDGDVMELNHEGGDSLVAEEIAVIVDGEREGTVDELAGGVGAEDTLGAGERWDLDNVGIDDEDTVGIVWEDPNGDSVMLLEEFESDANITE